MRSTVAEMCTFLCSDYASLCGGRAMRAVLLRAASHKTWCLSWWSEVRIYF